jgi:Fur family transcriptional regulator, ferric uptake regulator
MGSRLYAILAVALLSNHIRPDKLAKPCAKLLLLARTNDRAIALFSPTMATPRTAETLLRRAELRVTPARLQVLTTFLRYEYALPHSELETLVPECDRVTLYRTLGTFTEKGLLHRVPDDAGATKYALCAEHCAQHLHADNHVHFKCTHCGKTECLEGVRIPDLNLPDGYRVLETSLLVQGLCKPCIGQA